MVLVGRRTLILGLADDPEQLLYDRAFDIDLLHVVAVEPMPSLAA